MCGGIVGTMPVFGNGYEWGGLRAARHSPAPGRTIEAEPGTWPNHDWDIIQETRTDKLTIHGVGLSSGLAGAAKLVGSRMVRPGNRVKSDPLRVSSLFTP
jgi:hypothetical protein